MDIIKVDYKSILKFDEKVVGILGQFDGLHIGHRTLIAKGQEIAKAENGKVAILTFDPHPDYVLKKRDYNGYLTPLSHKLALLEELGVDIVVLIHFDLNLSQMEPEEFHKRFLSSIETIVVGTDYRYGFRGKGNTETLRASGKNVVAVDLITHNNQKVGSNTIRELLSEGAVDEIAMLLNHYYAIYGVVSHGAKVGRTLGIRTANVNLVEEYQVIRKGVYLVYVTLNNKKYHGVCNIGNNPSINTVEKMRLEVHILDFEAEIYGEDICIEFIKRVRDEIFFPSKEELIKQIQADIKYARDFFQGEV